MRNTQKIDANNCSNVIAWQGWELRVPQDWRPLEIAGDYKRGKMMIGNAEIPVVQIKWWRPEEKEFYDYEWIAARIRKLKALPSDNPPRPPGFSNTGWVKDLEFKENISKTIWYGYAKSAGVMMELVMTSIADSSIRKMVVSKILPNLKVYRRDEETRWALYNVSYRIPSGWILSRKHLYSGDIALEFTNSENKSLLVVRQVYPAELALSRRSMEQWLENPVFRTRRKFHIDADTKYRFAEKRFDRALLRKGKLRVAFPLAWLKPLCYDAMIAVDSNLDRLYIAEVVSKSETDSSLLEEIVLKMNDIDY